MQSVRDVLRQKACALAADGRRRDAIRAGCAEAKMYVKITAKNMAMQSVRDVLRQRRIADLGGHAGQDAIRAGCAEAKADS